MGAAEICADPDTDGGRDMSEEIKANIVHLRHDGKCIYATDSQVAIIIGMRNDSDKRNNFVKVGAITFSPADVAYIETATRPSYDFPKYFLNRYNEETSKLIKIN